MIDIQEGESSTERTYFRIKEYEVERSWEFHWHQFYEIEYVLEGECVQHINHEECTLRKGSITLLTPDDFHKIDLIEGSRLRVINIRFSEHFIGDEIKSLLQGHAYEPLHIALDEREHTNMRRYTDCLMEENICTGMHKELAIRSILTCIILNILRSKASGEAHTTPSKPLLNIQQSLAFIRRNFRDTISLDSVAQESGLTPNYFSEYFHKAMGICYKQYVINLRLNYAVWLLTGSDMDVTGICFESGFDTLPNFYKSFKRRYGISPRKYRLRR